MKVKVVTRIKKGNNKYFDFKNVRSKPATITLAVARLCHCATATLIEP